MEKLLLTVSEAADQVGLSRSKLYALVLRGEVPSVQIGRARRIPVDALCEWVRGLDSDVWSATASPVRRRGGATR